MPAETLSPLGFALVRKIANIRWSLVVMVTIIAGVGVMMLYSAADASAQPWAVRHAVRFAVTLGLALVIAVIDLRLWMRFAYWLYGGALALLVAVEVAGSIGMGARRWIDLGFMQLQPSELMKIAVVLALARMFHGMSLSALGRPWRLILPLGLVLVPAVLVLRQPDLGTTLMMLIGAAAVMFAAGVRLWMFIAVAAAGLAALPVGWHFLHGYQKNRVLTFLDPERDPLGAGYHILQSKIALGSGGLHGKGFLQGTQSHLNFLPEKQTDFIFTMFAEEFGLIGTLSLLALYTLVIATCLAIALRCRSQFGRLLATGLSVTFFLYLFINMAMVMGLLPVVGVPLPLVSYGGSATLSLMIGFGLILSVHVHRDLPIGRFSAGGVE